MKAGDRVFVEVCDIHRGWAVLVQNVGEGRWLVRLEPHGGEIVLPVNLISHGR